MATDIGVDRRRGRRKKRGVVGWMNRLPGDEWERERVANRSAATADNKAALEGGRGRVLFCSGTARRRPIVRRVDNFKTKPRRPAVHCAKITGKQRKRGGVGGWSVGPSVRLSFGWQTTRESLPPPLADAFISRLRNPGSSSDSRSTNRPCPRRRGWGRGGEGDRGRARERLNHPPVGNSSTAWKRPVDTPTCGPMTLAIRSSPPPPPRYYHFLADDFLRSASNPCSTLDNTLQLFVSRCWRECLTRVSWLRDNASFNSRFNVTKRRGGRGEVQIISPETCNIYWYVYRTSFLPLG